MLRFFNCITIMDKDKTAVFIGHSNCPLSVEDIIPFIEHEILNGVDTFLNGGQGGFDINSAYAVHKLKSKYPNIKNILVIPYHNFRIYDKSIFDEIINPNTSNSASYTGFKTAIPKRNRYMVKSASTAICYVNHISGGAYKTYQLAQRKKLRIINICDELKRQSYERKDIMQSKFVSVTTELLALACLMQGPTNAYGVMKTIEEHAIKGTEISQNQAFTALYYLCKKNYVKQETINLDGGSTRDVYSLLPEGVAYYKSFLEDYNRHVESVNQVLSVLK